MKNKSMEGLKRLSNCQRCGKVFVREAVPVCRDCLALEEKQYLVVKEYLHKNPGVPAVKVSEATGVPAQLVIEFLRKGLLAGIKPGPNESLTCVICKRPIASGSVCLKCEKTLLSMFSRKDSPKPGADSQRMYSAEAIFGRRK